MVFLIADTAVCVLDAITVRVQIIFFARCYKAWSLLIFIFAILSTILCWCNVKVEFLENYYKKKINLAWLLLSFFLGVAYILKFYFILKVIRYNDKLAKFINVNRSVSTRRLQKILD